MDALFTLLAEFEAEGLNKTVLKECTNLLTQLKAVYKGEVSLLPQMYRSFPLSDDDDVVSLEEHRERAAITMHWYSPTSLGGAICVFKSDEVTVNLFDREGKQSPVYRFSYKFGHIYSLIITHITETVSV